jgi:hypothetical protein
VTEGSFDEHCTVVDNCVDNWLLRELANEFGKAGGRTVVGTNVECNCCAILGG